MSPEGTETAGVKPLHKWMRLNLLIGSALPLLAGLSLFVGTTKTKDYSAWTIQSEITAATIGAAYWAGFFMSFLSGLERTWARARPAVYTILIFTTFGFVLTAIDLDLFHTDSGGFGTQLLTWVWLIPYAAGPILMIVLLRLQLALPGGDPPRGRQFDGWLRSVLTVQAALLAAVGIALFIAPVDVSDAIWPFDMKGPGGRFVGAWLFCFGAGIFFVLRENDFSCARPGAASMTVFGALQIVVLLRYTDAVDWGSPRLLAYLLFLVSMLAVGAYALRESAREAPAQQEPAAAGS